MLVTRRSGGLTLMTHPDHGRLAGALCAHWGNERFAAPRCLGALGIAATHHDDGWLELDDPPTYEERARRPAHFLELALDVIVPAYGRGVDSVYRRNVLAGALVSMHWSGLYATRWGVQGGSPVAHPLAAMVVAEQDGRRLDALRRAWNGRGLRSAFEADVWHAYEVLQALDFVALALGLLDVEGGGGTVGAHHGLGTVGAQGGGGTVDVEGGRGTVDVEGGRGTVAMPETLARVDQPPGARRIPLVPLAAGAGHVDLRLWIDAPGHVIIDPFPFDAHELEVELPVRRIEDRAYASARDAADTLRHTPFSPLRVLLSGPAADAVRPRRMTGRDERGELDH